MTNLARPTVVKLLGSLEELWTRKRPAIRRGLRPGVRPAMLDAFSSHFDVKLPSAFRTFYQWHDGLRDEHCAFEGFFGWCSLRSLRKQKLSLDQMEQQGFFDDWGPGSWWNLSWVPFLQFNLEDHVCIDTRGTLGKGKGVVFIRRNTDPRRTIIATSFHTWLQAHVELTAAGPDNADEDSWTEYFSSRRASRIRRAFDPTCPSTVRAAARTGATRYRT